MKLAVISNEVLISVTSFLLGNVMVTYLKLGNLNNVFLTPPEDAAFETMQQISSFAFHRWTKLMQVWKDEFQYWFEFYILFNKDTFWWNNKSLFNC